VVCAALSRREGTEVQVIQEQNGSERLLREGETGAKQGRFFPERYQHSGKELASAVIANYLTTLPTSGKKPTTIAEEQYYGRWWTDRLIGKALHAVSPALLEQAMADLATKHYTPQTIVHYLKFLRHVFRWAIGRGVIEKSPFASVKLPTVRAGRTRFLSIEEEARCARRSVNRMTPGQARHSHRLEKV
jgi:hypothetical protein